ncbi:MAG TPA: hypothetical protein P5222_01790, partial [Candidatus Cloacimonadota bacterium]|nr:hypothetical protein [Candidatus Cloacimonadota bacterium]HRS49421.1 hypothetical protein [Candidatus Cloacimonadota bacterium]
GLFQTGNSVASAERTSAAQYRAICVNRLTRDPLGWQNPFATETGGLFQTGNSVASANGLRQPNTAQSA